jgi:AcrR family transcriptional regulator
MKVKVQFNINPNIYLRDPQETKLGQNIIQHSINLIHEIGFENFNFKKLSLEINCTEASVYRYFENKHKLLNFLTAWYWELVNFNIEFANANLTDPSENLKQVIKIITHHSTNFVETEVNEKQLHTIIINEASKSFHVVDIDQENKQGNFTSYKKLIIKITDIIIRVNPKYRYPNSLATLLMDTAIDHEYYAEHLPKLVNLEVTNLNQELYDYLIHLTNNLLKIDLEN